MNRTLEDELLIRRTMERYMRYNDDRALDRVVSLFTADAVYRVVGEEHVGHEAIRAFLGARGFEDDRPEWTEPDQLMVMPRSTHVMSNPVIEVHGDDATAESDFVVIARTRGSHAHPVDRPVPRPVAPQHDGRVAHRRAHRCVPRAPERARRSQEPPTRG